MKPENIGKISTIILWLCMIVTLGIFAWFYYGVINKPDSLDTMETSVLLNWLYILLLVTISVSCIFSFYKFVIRWKDKSLNSWQSLLGFIVLGLLLGTTYGLGNGTPLSIFGYEGKENTYYWLKITDMWIYSIYVLLGITIIAVFAGILWSYIKKTK